MYLLRRSRKKAFHNSLCCCLEPNLEQDSLSIFMKSKKTSSKSESLPSISQSSVDFEPIENMFLKALDVRVLPSQKYSRFWFALFWLLDCNAAWTGLITKCSEFDLNGTAPYINFPWIFIYLHEIWLFELPLLCYISSSQVCTSIWDQNKMDQLWLYVGLDGYQKEKEIETAILKTACQVPIYRLQGNIVSREYWKHLSKLFLKS